MFKTANHITRTHVRIIFHEKNRDEREQIMVLPPVR